jgi:hypothetical protein
MSSATEPSSLVDRLIAYGLLSDGGEVVEKEVVARKLGVSLRDLEQALWELVDKRMLAATMRWRCPECDLGVGEELIKCPDCRTDRPANLELALEFARVSVSPARDPRAVFLIHGMTTRGEWQERLSWRLALTYGYSVPVRVFKYGSEAWSPFWGREHRRLARKLGEDLLRAHDELGAFKPAARCDVVAHSFGTLLLALALRSPEFAGLRLGRVILTGGIVPRDYPWEELISSGRVEAILNHRAGRDQWVRWAPWAFPGTGSSGRDGYLNQPAVVESLSESLRHSDYFKGNRLEEQVSSVWDPFLSGLEPVNRTRVTSAPTALIPVSSGVRFVCGRVVLVAALILIGAAAGAVLRALCALMG